jgi:hypothetical protein
MDEKLNAKMSKALAKLKNCRTRRRVKKSEKLDECIQFP